jgi:hypothetical protein
MSRFAPITADLLARKGEAAPSAQKQAAWFAPAARPIAAPPDPVEKPHRIMVALSAREYETLGIAAVKKGTTRHQIARAAMDSYFAELAHEFHDRCRCVSDAAREGGCCREG